MLQFSFALWLNLIFLCLKIIIIIHYHAQKTKKKMILEPGIKLTKDCVRNSSVIVKKDYKIFEKKYNSIPVISREFTYLSAQYHIPISQRLWNELHRYGLYFKLLLKHSAALVSWSAFLKWGGNWDIKSEMLPFEDQDSQSPLMVCHRYCLLLLDNS